MQYRYSIFGSNYSDSQQAMSHFSTEPLKHHQIGCKQSSSGLCTDALWDFSLQFCWATQRHSDTWPEVTLDLSWLYTLAHGHAERLTITPVSGCLHSKSITSLYLAAFIHHSLPPVPAVPEMHAHSMLASPWFTVGMVLARWWRTVL